MAGRRVKFCKADQTSTYVWLAEGSSKANSDRRTREKEGEEVP